MEDTTMISESDLEITMRDLAFFSNWMQRAVPVLEQGGNLPTPPEVESPLVRRWVAAIERLQERDRQKLETQEALLKNLTMQELQLDEILSNLYTNMAALYETLGHGDHAGTVKRKFSTLQAVA